MSQDFKKVLVKDARLHTTDQIAYAVEVGAQNMTPAQFVATSQSTSSHTYNIQVPSEQTIIDRRVLWKSTVVLAVSGTAPLGQFLINYGYSDALAPFPLHSLASVMSATINNNTTSINMRDVLPAILRFNDKRELSRYNGYTPTQFDMTADYQNLLGGNNNPLGAYANTSDNDLSPRGSWILDAIGTNYNANTGVISVNPVVSAGVAQTVYVKFSVSEPLLMSPFIFCDPKQNNQGFYGVQNLNFVFNIGDGSRVWRSGCGYPKTCQIVAFQDSQLCFNFLTAKADGSSMLSARNCVGYYELPRYITTPNVPIASGASADLQTSNLQLNQIPDALIIMVRKPQSSLTPNDPDFCLAINSISINFNNSSGILASASKQDLYRYSVENFSNQSYYEFSGKANIVDNASGKGQIIATSGSYLILQFGKDIQLQESYYASGSLGNFNLQMRINCSNQTSASITPEICVITKNSGVWCNERGTSQVFTGLLGKSDVLEALSMPAYSGKDVERLVGGGFLDSLKSVAGNALPILGSLGKNLLAQSSNPYAQAGASVLGSLGMGKSGAGTSGAGNSGAGSSGGARLKGRIV